MGVVEDASMIGRIARFDPPKDHLNFIRAGGELHRGSADVHFLHCGDRGEWQNATPTERICAAGMGNRVHVIGRRENMPRLLD